jgi:hypothetical protein
LSQAQVADSHAGFEGQDSLVAGDQVADRFFGLMRFVDGKNGRRNSIDLKSGIARRHAVQVLVLHSQKCATPFWNPGLREQARGRESYADG